MADEDDLRHAIAALSKTRSYQDMQNLLSDLLSEQAESGQLVLGPDHQIGGPGLEIRVRLLLAQIGLTGSRTASVAADLVVPPPNSFRPDRPLVIEIKSGKGRAPDRANLRQLDDWVFELSGEARARKRNIVAAPAGLRGQLSPVAAPVHPSPHKGVFIYNGPLGTEFVQRPKEWLGPNEIAFAEKRNFCVLRLETLIAWISACSTEEKRREFWNVVQETAGILRDP
jgi:hypothetical protein